MIYEGVLTKMQTEYSNPIQYYLVFDNSFFELESVAWKINGNQFCRLPMFGMW